MNLNLNYEGFEDFLVDTWRDDNALYIEVHYVFRFENNYGASVVKGNYTYGSHKDLWELAVIEFRDDSSDDFELTYDTPITSDVKGWLTDEDVRNLLQQIKGL